MKNLKKLTNLKKLNRADLKRYNGGKLPSYQDMCTNDGDCPAGLSCGEYCAKDYAVGWWCATRCM